MTIIYISSERERSGKTSFVTTLAKKLTTAGKKVTIIIPPDMNGSDTHVTDLMIKDLLSTVPENEFPKIRSDISLDSSGLTTIKSLAATNDYDSSVCLIEEPSSQTTINPSELLASLDAICLDIVKFHAEISHATILSRSQALGNRLAGVIINGVTRYKKASVEFDLIPSFCSSGPSIFGAIPENRTLLSSTVKTLANNLNGRIITGEDHSDALVKHFMVGGWTLDSGELYFGIKEDKAAIIRGDRPDMQMSALNTNISCLICTNGIEPIEYVLYEANQQDIPIVVVETDTLSTMKFLNELKITSHFDHKMKLLEFEQLMDEWLDLDHMYNKLGISI